jgi:hypothetical protein
LTTCQSCKNTNPSCQKWNHVITFFYSKVIWKDIKYHLLLIIKILFFSIFIITIFFLFFHFFFTMLVYFFAWVLWTILVYEYCCRQVQMIPKVKITTSENRTIFFYTFVVSSRYLKNEMSDLNKTWYTHAWWWKEEACW